VLGSIELGVLELKIPLIVVLGHERCGAVKATIGAVEKHVYL
jgi:carbonic anhydrase